MCRLCITENSSITSGLPREDFKHITLLKRSVVVGDVNGIHEVTLAIIRGFYSYIYIFI